MPEIRGVHQLIAVLAQAIQQRLAILTHLAADVGLGGIVHNPADHDHIAGDLGSGIEHKVAVDHRERALDPARDEHRAVADGHIPAPLIAARELGAAHQPGRARVIVEADDFVGHDPRQRAGLQRHAGAFGMNDDRRVLKRGQR